MEVVIFPLKTSLTAAITTTVRPVTFTVAATNALLGSAGAVFSCLIYDAGTDANPTNAEALQITAGGGGLSWTGTTEVGSSALTHANNSTVLATIVTPRSLAQPLTDHVTTSTTPDPHSIYLQKAFYLAKGDILVGTGSGAVARLPAPANDGVPLVSAHAQPLGVQWQAGTNLSPIQTGGVGATASASMIAVPGGITIKARATLTTVAVVPGLTQIQTIAADNLTSISFNSIGPYNTLRITGSARSLANIPLDTLQLRCNGDANPVYNTQSILVQGVTSTASQIDLNATAMTVTDVPGLLTLQVIPMVLELVIPSASGQSFAKMIIARSTAITTNTGAIGLEMLFRACAWNQGQSPAINSITLSLVNGSFQPGSTFTLWGEL